MRTMQRLKLALALGAGLMLGSASAALAAGGDSDADAGAGFVKQVEQSTALMIRVPINEKGQENTDAAELRLHNGASVSTSSNLVAAFEAGVPASTEQSVSAADVSKDSSTHGWYGWRGCGWQQQNYYYYYQPTYYSCGSYYTYYQPIYYNYYTQPNYCGYRYYYYQRHW